MKAEIISQHIYEGGLDFFHSGGHRIERILVPEKNNLVITTEKETLYISDDFKKTEDYEKIRDIEIPDEFVEEVIAFMKTEKGLLQKTKKLIEE